MRQAPSTFSQYKALAIRSLVVPEEGARVVLRLPLTMQQRLMWLAAAVATGGTLAYLLPLMSGTMALMPSPIAATVLQIGLNLAAVAMMTGIGRLLGGKGDFQGALILMAWLQTLMVGFQIVQLVVMIVIPPLANLVFFGIVAAILWLMTGFVRELHGFASRLGVLGVMLLVAFVLGSIFGPLLLNA